MPTDLLRGGLARLGVAALLLAGVACTKPEPTGHGSTQLAGELVYSRRCATCHQSNGMGSAAAWPPLVGSPWLIDDHETPIRIVLLGVQGEMVVNGIKYFGVMPNQGVIMSDREIADSLSFARSAWGNHADPILESEVAKVRASLGDRTKPWTAHELEALRNR